MHISKLNLPGLKSRDSSRAEKAQYTSSHGLKPLGDFCEGLKIYSQSLPIVIGILISCTLVVCSGKAFAEENRPFIKVSQNTLIKDGKPFKFIGANAVNLVFYDDWDLDIEEAIRTARENNISVLRLYIDLGWGKDSDFDRIFDIAAKYGVYIILAFTDCCCSADYPDLRKYFEVHAPFCNITNKKCIKAFKRLIKSIIERKNSINGRIYRDDPVVLAWEIANELEYWRFSESAVHDWSVEIATYIKTLDKNHLITLGVSTVNLSMAHSFSLNAMFDIPALDFISFHFYPDAQDFNIQDEEVPKKAVQQIRNLTKKFLSLSKPVVMSEFGFSNSKELNSKTKTTRPEYYNLVFKEFIDAAFSAGASGAMFWGWGVSEEKNIPMWWSKECHWISDKIFIDFIKHYNAKAMDDE